MKLYYLVALSELFLRMGFPRKRTISKRIPNNTGMIIRVMTVANKIPKANDTAIGIRSCACSNFSNIKRKDTGYYFRQSLPKHVAAKFRKREIVRSLGMKDAREAEEIIMHLPK